MSAVKKPEPYEIVSKCNEIVDEINAGKGEQARAEEPIKLGDRSPVSQNKELPKMSVPANANSRQSGGKGDFIKEVTSKKPDVHRKINLTDVSKSTGHDVSPNGLGANDPDKGPTR